ncbi:MAG: tail fiber domain-containing protein [Bacteroidales bacterium]
MKTRFFLSFILALSSVLCALSQIPQGFNYQAIARDADGNPITGATIKVKLSVLSDTTGFYSGTGGTYIWEEEHTGVVTNSFGMFTVILGSPSAVKVQGSAASFSEIDWSAADLYVGTKIANPTTYKVMGSAKLWSVPYSMMADDISGSVKKLTVAGETTSMEEPLFEVKNKNGRTVFAVYNEGVRAYVSDGDAKGKKGGFAIGSFDASKGEQDLFIVTADSIRAYIYDNPLNKGIKGGFAIGGFDPTKALTKDYLLVSPDSVRIYLDHNTGKGVKGGFAIGSFDPSKGMEQEYFVVNRDSVRVYIDDGEKKAVKGGFAIGSFDASKAGKATFFDVSPNTNDIILSENRILWYPLKNAFLTGKVIIQAPDSVGENSFASGFESKAKGNYSQALGYRAYSRGNYSTAIGQNSVAQASNSYAFGKNANAMGVESFAFGSGARATGLRSFAFGSVGLDSLGNPVEENFATASGTYSIALGLGATATKKGGMSFGVSSQATEDYSLAIGYSSRAVGLRSLAIGSRAGYSESVTYPAPFNYVHQNANYSKGAFAMTIGSGNTADAGALAIGLSNNAGSWGSIALGFSNKTTAERSLAAGYRSEATGIYAMALGNYTVAQSFNSFVVGGLNVIEGSIGTWVETDPLFVVGNGKNLGTATVRSNAFKVSKNGDTRVYGNLYGDKLIKAGQGLFSDSLILGSYKGSMVNTVPYIRMKEYKNFPTPQYTKEYRMTVSGRVFSLSDETQNYLTVNSGNVGVKTNTPSEALHVNGNIRALGSLIGTGSIEIGYYDSGNRYSFIDFHGDDTYTDYSFRIIRSNDGPNAYSKLEHRGTGELQLHTYEAAPISFFTSGTRRLIITSAGDIGIGVLSPSAKLDVNGYSYFRSAIGIGVLNTDYTLPLYLQSTSTSRTAMAIRNTSSNHTYVIQTVGSGEKGRSGNFEIWNTGAGVSYLTINQNGNTGLGTSVPSSTYRLYVAGSAYSTGSWAGSDARYKIDIAPVETVLGGLLRLDPVTYLWNREAFPEMGFDDNRHLGLIAQDVEKVFPELVSTDENGYKAVAYDKLSVILIQGMKELQQLIESQQQENIGLKSELQSLREELEQIKAVLAGNR